MRDMHRREFENAALIVSQIHFSLPVIWGLGSSGAAIVIFSLIFSWQAYRGWLGRSGLDMTILGLGELNCDSALRVILLAMHIFARRAES